MADEDSTIQDIQQALQSCDRALEQLGATCCMAERSARMQALSTRLNELGRLLDGLGGQPSPAPDTLGKAQAATESVGAALGALYATCCTPTRERLYTLMFRSLGTIHMGLWRLGGAQH